MNTKNISAHRPYMNATEAARTLGYTQSAYLTRLCHNGKIPGAYKSGRIWFIPGAWVEEQKKKDAADGIKRGPGQTGRRITTGAGLNRKRPEYQPTGRPRGRPKKSP